MKLDTVCVVNELFMVGAVNGVCEVTLQTDYGLGSDVCEYYHIIDLDWQFLYFLLHLLRNLRNNFSFRFEWYFFYLFLLLFLLIRKLLIVLDFFLLPLSLIFRLVFFSSILNQEVMLNFPLGHKTHR